MLGAILGGAALLGPLLGKASGGAASERGNQNDYQLRQNQLTQQGHQFDIQALLNALQQNERGRMDRAQLGISAPQARAKQALLGSLLTNAQTIKAQPPAGVRMGGGGIDLTSLLSGARQAGRDLTSQATTALQTGSDIPAFTDATSQLTKSPAPAGYKKAGTLESLMSGGGTIASLLGSLGSLKGPRPNSPGFEYF